MEIWSCRCAIYMQNYLSRTEPPLQTWLFQGTNPAFHSMYNNTRLQPHLGYKVAPMLLTHGLARTIVNYTCNKHPAKTDRPALYNKNKPSQFRVKSPCLQRNRPRKGTATNTAIQKMCEKEFLESNKYSLCTQSWATSTQSTKMHCFNATRYVQIMFTAEAQVLYGWSDSKRSNTVPTMFCTLPRKANQCSSSAYVGIHRGSQGWNSAPAHLKPKHKACDWPMDLTYAKPRADSNFQVQFSNEGNESSFLWQRLTFWELYISPTTHKKTGPANDSHKKRLLPRQWHWYASTPIF